MTITYPELGIMFAFVFLAGVIVGLLWAWVAPEPDHDRPPGAERP